MDLGNIHLRRRQNFPIFDPSTLPIGIFLLLSILQIWPIYDPSPLKNANVLNGWSLVSLFCTDDKKFGITLLE